MRTWGFTPRSSWAPSWTATCAIRRTACASSTPPPSRASGLRSPSATARSATTARHRHSASRIRTTSSAPARPGRRGRSPGLSEGDVEAAHDDGGGASPGPDARPLAKHEKAHPGRPDQLDVVEGREESGGPPEKGAGHAVVPEGAEHSEGAQGQPVGEPGRGPPEERD